MSKPRRGKSIRHLPHQGRGTCPACKTTGIKLLYERVLKDGTKVKVNSKIVLNFENDITLEIRLVHR